MKHLAFRRCTLVILTTLMSSCAYDSTTVYDPPDDPADDPPVISLIDGLWTVSGSEAAIEKLAPAQLLESGNISAATTVTTSNATLFTINSIAFDAAGTMWIASRNDSLLVAFAPAALATSGNREANRIIAPTNRSLRGPTGLAFDRQHRLWVANFDNNTIVRYDSAQLVTTGAPVPAMIINGIDHPTSLAFDATGALWVSQARKHAIIKFGRAKLEQSSPDPDVVLNRDTTGSSLATPVGLAFDAVGNLWVANSASETVVAFSPAQLAASGEPEPNVTLTAPGGLGMPTGLAFDSQGSLWVMGATGILTKFGVPDFDISGVVLPRVRLQFSGDVFFWSVAFWPKPGGFPLN